MGDVMPKFSINYSDLVNQITKKAYRLSDVKDQIEVVAFDVVKFKDADKGADLWQVQSSDDGDYIVALYPEEDTVKEASSDWDVRVLKTAGEIQISYKGDPITRMSYAKLGIPRNELPQVEQYLPEKLASNKKLVRALLSQLSEPAKLELYKRYPELV